jgi:DNA-binding GntR family transcriptional regulator
VLNYRTKAELVYDHLRERILTGELAPGARVSISAVARDLGVSDIPVREGVKRLESDGLLVFETHKGAMVTRMGAADVEELFAIRTELEALAVRRAAAAVTPETLASLRRLLDDMATAERRRDFGEYGQLNRQFHLAIYEAQPYRRLSVMIRNLWDSTDWCRRIFISDADYLLASTEEHEGIFEALERRDGEAAAAFLRHQKQRACEWLLNRVEPGDLTADAQSER